MAETVQNKMPLTVLSKRRYGNLELYNLTKDYDWTMAPKTDAARSNVASMYLTQFEMDANAMIANLMYWAKPLFNEQSSPYEGLYVANKTGVHFQFPWFEEYHHNITQNWEDFKGLESTQLGEGILKGWQLLTNSPGIAVNTPKVWKGGSRASIPYTITLFNTTSDPEKSIKQNQKFINRLIASTLHDQQNSALVSPPAIYTLFIPGVRYSPACVIAGLEITNIGTIIKYNSGTIENGYVIPEAWKIKFTISELISESRQIFDGATSGTSRKRVTAIIKQDDLFKLEERNSQANNNQAELTAKTQPPPTPQQ